jgi:hypothetical protein
MQTEARSYQNSVNSLKPFNRRGLVCCGQVAGAFYGESGIPHKWLAKLVMREEISTLADRLFATNKAT